jgi:hypothetical protein
MLIPLRAGPSGPLTSTGVPPVVVSPNIATLAAYFHGASAAPTTLVAVDTLIAGMTNGALVMRAGCRYLIEGHLSCSTPHDCTTALSFVPTYSTHAAGGAFPALAAMRGFQGWTATPTASAELWVGPAGSGSLDMRQGNIGFAELVIPTVEQVAMCVGVRVAAVVAGMQLVNDWNCFVKVWELGGLP